jgi:hypothetical protein
MKTRLYFFTLALIALGSCTRMEKDEASRNNLTRAYASRDSIENEMVRTMDEINKNLDLIREKQGIIASSKSGESISKKQEILKTISLINSLLEENKKKIAELNAQAIKLREEAGEHKTAMARVAEQTRARIQKQEK